jgi:hypothetical protein
MPSLIEIYQVFFLLLTEVNDRSTGNFPVCRAAAHTWKINTDLQTHHMYAPKAGLESKEMKLL